MSKSFLFLEITDPDINAFFSDLLLAVNGVLPDQRVHLTIRGPYRTPIRASEINECRKAMEHDVLRIRGASRFGNPDEEVVFFGVDSPNLRRVWWKPDYPIHEYGFCPHLSIYRGKNALLADALAEFISAQGIELLCSEFEIVPVIGKQLSLFSEPVRRSSTHVRFMESGRVPIGFFEGLEEVLAKHESVAGGRRAREQPHVLGSWTYDDDFLTSESRDAFLADLTSPV